MLSLKFRIIELLIVISVIGLACGSLKQSDPLFETIFFSFTLAFVLASMLLAVGRTGGARAFWIGFSISSLSYLVFAHVPDGDDLVPRHDGPEITTQLLRHGYNWLHADTYDSNLTSPPGEFFSVDDDSFSAGGDNNPISTTTDVDHAPNETADPFPGNLSLIIHRGQQIIADGRSMSFMRIGHSAWALLTPAKPPDPGAAPPRIQHAASYRAEIASAWNVRETLRAASSLRHSGSRRRAGGRR